MRLRQKEEREEERVVLTSDSIPKSSTMARTKPGAGISIQLFHMGARDPRTSASTCLHASECISSKLELEGELCFYVICLRFKVSWAVFLFFPCSYPSEKWCFLIFWVKLLSHPEQGTLTCKPCPKLWHNHYSKHLLPSYFPFLVFLLLLVIIIKIIHPLQEIWKLFQNTGNKIHWHTPLSAKDNC